MPFQFVRSPRAARFALAAAGLALALAGCGEQEQAQQGGALPVGAVTVQPERAPITSNLPGRVEAVRDAQIRARVTGIVQKIAFRQGGDVKAGELLFKIDPAPSKAAYDQAAAQLKQAQADLYAARQLAERYGPLVKANAVSRQEYDNAVAASRQAEAAVAAAQAALTNAKINLGYTDVVSPIDGRIGQPLVTEGALVEATSATQMALVQQLDPIYVDFSQSTAELARLRKAFAAGSLQRVGEDAARAQVVLEDGSVYEHDGKLLFTGITVDPGTGQVVLRAEFPNPDLVLLPGMYVRVRLEEGVNEQALLVPQQALQRTADGMQTLMLVRDGKVAPAPVSTGAVVGSRIVVTQGLNAGDVVIVEGFQKIRPGAPVQAVPWQPAGQAAGQPGQGGQPQGQGQGGPQGQGQAAQPGGSGQAAGQQAGQ